MSAVEKHVRASSWKYSKIVENAAQVELKLSMYVTSWESVLEAENACIARFEEACID